MMPFRSFTSSAFLFPSKSVWNATDVLAITDTKNYTTANIEQFFKDANYTVGWEQYKHSGTLLGNLEAPGVEVRLSPKWGVIFCTFITF